jgi:hypothetical protein
MNDRSWMYKDSPNSYGGWIIIMGYSVLVITPFLIREMLVDEVDVHARGVKIKGFLI